MKRIFYIFSVFFVFLFSPQVFSQKKIGIITSGDFNNKLFKNIKKEGKRLYGIKVKRMGKFKLPNDGNLCFMCDGKYYDVYKFPGAIRERLSKNKRVIAITHESLIDGESIFFLDSIAGITYRDRRTALVTDGVFLNDSLYIIKTTNVVLHEMGHILFSRAFHCEDSKCVMVAYEGFENIDLCEKCKKLFSELKKQKKSKIETYRSSH